MLESLRIRNFKRHEALDIVFPSGMTICTGKNYQGKSTVLQAILFAFFGVSAVPGGSKLVVKRGTPQSSMSAELTFFHRGQRYRLERSFNNAALYADNTLIASSKSAVNAQLEEIFGTPQKFFMRLKYAEQGQTQALLTMGAEELHKIVEHVSGASTVNEVIAKASKRATAAGNRLEEVGQVEPIEPLKEQVETLRDSVTQADVALSNALSHWQQATDVLKEKESALTKATKANQEIADAQENHRSLLTRQKFYQEEVSMQEDLAKEHQVLASGVNDKRTKYAEITALATAHMDLLDVLNTAKTEHESVTAQLTHSRGQLTYAQEQLGKLPDMNPDDYYKAAEEALRVAIQWRSESERRSETLTSGVCSSCHRPFDDFNPAAAQAALTEAQQALAQANAFYDDKRLQYHTALGAQEQRQKFTEIVKALTTVTIPELEDRLVALAEKIYDTETALNQLAAKPTTEQVAAAQSAMFDAIEAERALKAAQDSRQVAQKRLDEIQADLTKIKNLPEPVDLTQLMQEAQAQRSLVGEYNEKRYACSDTFSRLKSDLKLAREKLASVEAKAGRAAELAKEKDTAQRLTKYLKSNRDRFMGQLWQQVMNYASEFASACTGGAIERVVRTDAGAFEFVEEGQPAPLEAASGAQKSIMSVAVQLAFDALLPDSFGALMLDEPTSQMDEDHALALSQMLANSGRQIIMVSHREADASIAQAHVHLN